MRVFVAGGRGVTKPSSTTEAARSSRGCTGRCTLCAVLIVISGLPGVGKTTLAAALARRIRSTHVSVDAIEDALLSAGCEPGWTTGVAAYEAARAAAEQNLALGQTVVVDAVNDSDGARQTWRRAATSTGAVLRFVLLRPPRPEEHQRRLRDRTRPLLHVPEPSWDRVVERALAYEPWSDPLIEVSAQETVAALVERLVLAQS